MPVDPAPRPRRGLVRSAGVVAVAISSMNVMTYAFTAAVARQVAPSDFGAITALLGILLVGSVAALGLQATTARRLATRAEERVDDVVAAARQATYVIGAAVGALVLVLSPLLVRVLALDHWFPLAVVAATLVPLTVFGAQAGVAQGTAQWGRLAGLYAAVGVGRIGFGIAGAAVWPTTSGAMVGVLLGSLVPVALGWRLIHPAARPAPGTSHVRSLALETLAGSAALLAFFAVTNADALLARVVLSPQSSGLYASGLIVTKAALFLPQFVAVVAFPSLARDDSAATRRTAVLVVGGLGVLTVAGTQALPSLALVFAGGERYAEIQGLLPLFAAEGATFALVHLFVYDSLADRSGRVAPVLWGVLGAVTLTTVLFVDSIVALTCTMIGAGVLVGAGLVLLRFRTPAARTAAQ